MTQLPAQIPRGASGGGDAERGLLAAIARAHYLEDRSRVEIAEMFGISRFKVTRLLKQAKDQGIVRIQISDTGLPDPALGARLQELLGLESCQVIRSHGDEDEKLQQLGNAAAQHLNATLREGETLGVAWGRTMTATAKQLQALPGVSLVQMSGLVAENLASPIAIMSRVAALTEGRVYPIFSPLFLENHSTADGLRRHPDIAAALARFDSIDTALLSIGSWDPADTTVPEALSERDRALVTERGCYADVVGILLTRDGELVNPDLQRRSITIPPDTLRKVPRRIALARGYKKAGAVRTAVRAGLVSELVTDHELANALLG